jgi:vancomycin permeability regulator SanA
MLLRLVRLLSSLVVLLLVAVFTAALAISVDGLWDRIPAADLAIVPGNSVTAQGTPSARLQGRLDEALNLYKAGQCKVILVSGGLGAEGFDEADVMKNYLVQRGVDKDDIVTDHHGNNTYETARFAADLIRTKGLRSPIVVSQFFHISRLRLALQKHGIQTSGNSHARYYELRDLYSLLREVAAYIEYAFKPNET